MGRPAELPPLHLVDALSREDSVRYGEWRYLNTPRFQTVAYFLPQRSLPSISPAKILKNDK